MSIGKAQNLPLHALPEEQPHFAASNEADDGFDPVGSNIRRERQLRGLSVRELARRAGVSPSLVSQVEHGKVQPSVRTLHTLANELNTSVDRLFSERKRTFASSAEQSSNVVRPRPQSGVVRSAERRRIRLAGGVQWELLTPAPDPNVEFLRVTYEVGASSCPPDALMRHGGFEYAHIISGRLGVRAGFEEYELDAGDSLSFSAELPHRLWAIGDEPAVAIWVIINRQRDNRI